MKKILITAGGTSEKIDNVRKITNSSSGKLGMMIANQLLAINDEVKIYYICPKNALKPSSKQIKIIEIEGTENLKNTIENILRTEKIDYFIHSMAVSDYTTNYITTIEKIKTKIETTKNIEEAFSNIEPIKANKISSNEDNLVIVLKKTPKIISMIKQISPKTYLIGFKLLDDVPKKELIEVAKKLRDKNNCDLVVANDLSTIRKGKHIAYIIDKNNNVEKALSKEEIVKKLVRRIINER